MRLSSNSDFQGAWRLFAFVAILAFAIVDPAGILDGPGLAQDSTGTGQGSGVAEAQQQTGTTTSETADQAQGASKYQAIIQILTKVFILAVLIEVGLAVVFKWRWFLRKAEGKGWKVPIAFVVSYAIVRIHEIDLPDEVVSALDEATGNPSEMGYIVSALIVAGGSSSVNGIFERLGWRNPLAQQEKAQLEQQKDTGRIWLDVTRTATSSGAKQPLTVAIDGKAVGTIPPDKSRFGGDPGHPVAAGTHRFKVSWTDADGNPGAVETSATIAAEVQVTVEIALT